MTRRHSIEAKKKACIVNFEYYLCTDMQSTITMTKHYSFHITCLQELFSTARDRHFPGLCRNMLLQEVLRPGPGERNSCQE